jgi:hypothetical protein
MYMYLYSDAIHYILYYKFLLVFFLSYHKVVADRCPILVTLGYQGRLLE